MFPLHGPKEVGSGQWALGASGQSKFWWDVYLLSPSYLRLISSLSLFNSYYKLSWILEMLVFFKLVDLFALSFNKKKPDYDKDKN